MPWATKHVTLGNALGTNGWWARPWSPTRSQWRIHREAFVRVSCTTGAEPLRFDGEPGWLKPGLLTIGHVAGGSGFLFVKLCYWCVASNDAFRFAQSQAWISMGCFHSTKCFMVHLLLVGSTGSNILTGSCERRTLIAAKECSPCVESVESVEADWILYIECWVSKQYVRMFASIKFIMKICSVSLIDLSTQLSNSKTWSMITNPAETAAAHDKLLPAALEKDRLKLLEKKRQAGEAVIVAVSGWCCCVGGSYWRCCWRLMLLVLVGGG